MVRPTRAAWSKSATGSPPSTAAAGSRARALGELLAYARAHGAKIARASISPDNAASLALADSYGFTQIAEQVDEVDGLELVFELRI